MLQSCGCRTDPKKNQQIQRRSREDSVRSGKDLAIFDEDLEVKTHYNFDRPDRCSPEPDPTQPEVVGGRRRVVQRPTRCEHVGSGLGTNLTWTDLWTPLNGNIYNSVCRPMRGPGTT